MVSIAFHRPLPYLSPLDHNRILKKSPQRLKSYRQKAIANFDRPFTFEMTSAKSAARSNPEFWSSAMEPNTQKRYSCGIATTYSIVHTVMEYLIDIHSPRHSPSRTNIMPSIPSGTRAAYSSAPPIAERETEVFDHFG